MQTQPESFFNREDEILEADNQIGQEIQKLSKAERSALFADLLALPRADEKKEDNEAEE